MEKIIPIELTLNRTIRKTYPDRSFWKYIIYEDPAQANSYRAHLSFHSINGNNQINHYEVIFNKNSNLSELFKIGENYFRLKFKKSLIL
ncbi:hypothetical protein [Lactiplantibacillus plantarum]|uniref:hypothetical protein n=1 Tax=Lactiplantibacillus plantarum TaxID=1590 RepID=UPI0009304C43|nr:hypothetical protein [Lactiplantibacillus plantarum]MBC6384194.1 hypothetical protein [Lactiplantibacillus plantarum]MBO2724777.1 hypothetical protein [Lactiplantibacillus plantarum]